MKLSEFINASVDSLTGLYPEREARTIILWLLEERLGIGRTETVLHPERLIDEAMLKGDMKRLEMAEPIQYVLGVAEFRQGRFKVGPGVLIPRPETERIVQFASDFLKPGDNIIDLCTGSGCIAWSIKRENPEAIVSALDISGEALGIAKSQGPEGEITFIKADILDNNQTKDLGFYDFIASNPPYIREKEKALMRANVLDYEPSIALFVPDEDPLVFHRAIARIVCDHLKPGGMSVVEINEELGKETLEIFRGKSNLVSELVSDCFGKPRFIRSLKNQA